VKGNRIGTDVAGSIVHPDGGNDIGVAVESSSNTIGGTAVGERNVISGNADGLVLARGSGNIVRGNFIGTDITGTFDRGNSVGINLSRYGGPTGTSNNTIGGLTPGQGNLISGNTTTNVFIADPETAANSLIGNTIGPDVSGNNAAAMTNGDGIRITAGAHDNVIATRNIISDNLRGIEITGSATTANVLRGNFIGTNPGSGTMGNSVGIHVSGSSGNVLGGTAPSDGNVIAFNSAAGIVITGAGVANPIRGNSLYGNMVEIDTNQGGNIELPAPVLSSTLFGTVSGFACANCAVDIFSDGSTDARFYQGTALAAPDGSFTYTNEAPFIETNLTAINTDGSGNSSELSFFLAIDSDGDGTNDATDIDDDSDGMPDESDACRVFPEDYDGHEDADGCPDPDNDSDGVCDSGLVSPSCAGSDSGKTAFFAAGHNHSNPTIDCRNTPEDADAFKDADGCPEPDNDNDGFPDASDQCPGDENVAGADGVLGSGEDQNHNGILNTGEDTVVVDGVLTTDDVVLTFEDYDLVLNTDGCHDSPGQDRDGDGYTDEVEELHLHTRGDDPCGTDAWPSDISATGISANRFDIIDLGTFVAPIRRLNTSPSQTGFDVRWDLRPGAITPPGTGPHINTQDLAATVTGLSGFPPMFGGQKALGRNCVVAP
jgi:hypothetical protein